MSCEDIVADMMAIVETRLKVHYAKLRAELLTTVDMTLEQHRMEDFLKNDEPQGNQAFCQMENFTPEVVKAMHACTKETGASKLFSASFPTGVSTEMVARGTFLSSQLGPLAEDFAPLVDGYIAGGAAITAARRNFPKLFLHYHRAGHCAIASPETQRGDTAFVRSEILRVCGASGVHAGTLGGEMKGG